MSQLRKDPVTGRWVIIAPDRAKRPIDYQHDFRLAEERFDPFLEGHESATPPEIMAHRPPGSPPNGPGWRVRVVPNKFPALQIENDLEPRGTGLYDQLNGFGAHEVIIECPHFETNLSRLPVDHVRDVLETYRARLADLSNDRRLAHGLIFKNKGALAGASLDHCHSQLIATGLVPSVVREELDGSLAFFNDHGRCIYDEMIRQELEEGVRVVHDSPEFLVFCPYAGRFPFETWIVPKRPGSHFEAIDRRRIDELGIVIQETLARLELALDDPPYNYVLHSAPFNTGDLPHYRWHLELLPRLTRVAGYEWGSGFIINPVPPENAAAVLRAIDVPSDYGKRQKASA